MTDREWRPDQGNQLLRATADRLAGETDDDEKAELPQASSLCPTLDEALELDEDQLAKLRGLIRKQLRAADETAAWIFMLITL